MLRIALLVVCVCSWHLFADPVDDALQRYQTLDGKKAMAVSFGDEPALGVGHGQTTDAAAAIDALRGCEQQRQRRGIAQPCEIFRLNDARISTAEAIKSNVAEPHPLVMWRYETPSTRLYLVGSIHVLKAALYPLPKQVEAAFDQADHVAVEVDTINADPRTLAQKTYQYARLPANMQIADVLSADQFDALQAALVDQGIAYANVSFFKPGILATQLAVVRLTAMGYLPDHGMEKHFLTRSARKTVHELETIESQLELLTSPPLSVQVEMLMETLEQMRTIEAIIAQMAHAWFSGEVDEFARLFEAQSGQSLAYRAFVEALLDTRNVGMAEKIKGYLSIPGTFFVLVGSAHLSGEHGIVALLDAEGISGHRVMSNEVIGERG